MFLLRKIAAAALLLFAAGAAQAQERTVDGWSLFTNENNCAVIRQFDGRVLWIAFAASNDSGLMMVLEDGVWGSVGNRAPLTVDLQTTRGTQAGEHVAITTSTGATLENGMKGVHITAPGNALLTAIARADGVTVSSGAMVTTFNTGPMTRVIGELRTCGSQF